MDELEKALFTGIHGSPELKRAETRQFLGEFKERVLQALTKYEVAAKQLNPQIETAAKDPRAKAIIIHGDINSEDAAKYQELAEARKLEFTVRHDPEFTGEIGLIVISD